MEDGPLALAIVFAVVVISGAIAVINAVRKAVTTSTVLDSAVLQTGSASQRRFRTTRKPPPNRKPAMRGPNGLAKPELVVRCRRSSDTEGRLLAIVENRSPASITIRRASLLFWPDADGRWTWLNLPLATSNDGRPKSPLPHVLGAGQDLTVPVALDALLQLVQEHMPAESDGFGFRFFDAQGDRFDSPVLRVASLGEDCPMRPPGSESE
jgi:hypothetical protein